MDLSFGLRTRAPSVALALNLGKISEEPDENIPKTPRPRNRGNTVQDEMRPIQLGRRFSKLEHNTSLPNIREDSPVEVKRSKTPTKTYDYFNTFVRKIRQFPDVYDAFIDQAKAKRVIKAREINHNQYYYNHIGQPQKSLYLRNKSVPKSFERRDSNCPTPPRERPRAIRTLSSRKLDINAFMSAQKEKERNPTGSQKRARIDDDMRSVALTIRSAKSRFSIRGGTRTQVKTQTAFDMRNKISLNRENPKFIKIFHRMAKQGGSVPVRRLRITSEKLSDYLMLRYPDKLVDMMMNYLEIPGPTSLDVFASMMEILVTCDETRQLFFVFDLFDMNKDQYICYKDAYELMQIAKCSCYDSDISRIHEFFEKKKKRMLVKPRYERKFRRFNLGHDLKTISTARAAQKSPTNADDIVQGPASYYNQAKPEALTFEDFLRIDFNGGKPELLVDFVKYLTGHNLYQLIGFWPSPKSLHFRRKSEDIISAAVENTGGLETLMIDRKYNYYKQLYQAMSLYKANEIGPLMRKFEILRCKNITKQTIINQRSFVKNWHIIFAAENDNIATRFYNILSGPDKLDVTKPRYLTELYNYVKVLDSKSLLKFAFDIYDLKDKGFIGPRQVSDMLFSLIPDTLAYTEWMILVDEFVDSFTTTGQTYSRLAKIYFEKFMVLFKSSIIPKEIINAFTMDRNINNAYNLVKPATPRTREKQKRNSRMLTEILN